jgi:SAM-dependent methyltransferase
MASLHLSKACCVEDFAHPDFLRVVREIFPHEVARHGNAFPRGREDRKHWEVAMAARAMDVGGALRPDAIVLGVAAGMEPTIFWLTTQVGRVIATDLYLDPGIWSEWADSSMINDPGRYWPFAWNPRRLLTQHMDALDLRYDDGMFDAVFSSSSVEHFGTRADVRRAMDEMYRVLRPGGIAAISTELRLAGPPAGIPGCLLFTPEELLEDLVGERAWTLLGPLDARVSAQTLAEEVGVEEHVEDFNANFAVHGRLVLHELTFRRYPQLVLRQGEHLWTSVQLALHKELSG